MAKSSAGAVDAAATTTPWKGKGEWRTATSGTTLYRHLDIDGMTCSNCSRRVENALNGLDGVWAKVDLGAHKATVRLKQEPDEATLRAAVRGRGTR